MRATQEWWNLAPVCIDAVLSIAESLPCGECGGSGQMWNGGKWADRISHGEADRGGYEVCPPCHGTGHPDPATVATGLAGLVTAAKETVDELQAEAWGLGRGPHKLAKALSALAKPQDKV